MGQKYISRVIIWDEINTVSKPILEVFLDWLDQRGTQVITCGDKGQPGPIQGILPHHYLCGGVGYYKEVTTDYRAKDDAFKALKVVICNTPDKTHHQEMRKALPNCLGWDMFLEKWRPNDLILTSCQIVRDIAQKLLFQRHKERYKDIAVPLLYKPQDTRKQNVLVTIPGSDQ